MAQQTTSPRILLLILIGELLHLKDCQPLSLNQQEMSLDSRSVVYPDPLQNIFSTW